MALNLSVPEETELKPRILVFGVGGAGGNAVNNMMEAELKGIDFVAANTDSQALTRNRAERRIQMGSAITQGLGAGMRPEIGAKAAEDSLQEIQEHLDGAHMAFITAGMGGGTGTGAAPVIARAARDHGILTVGVVTKPFQFEGRKRMQIADGGIEELQAVVDTLIVIPNQNLFRVANEKTTIAEAFAMADGVLHAGVRSITDLMVMPGLINLDFADVRTVMDEMGKAMMGSGEAEGEKRAIEAAHAAISNPLLDDVSMKGARGVLINITGGMDMTLYEVDEAANEVRNEADPDANIIVGSTFDDSLEGQIRVSVVATGIDVDPNMLDSHPVASVASIAAPQEPGEEQINAHNAPHDQPLPSYSNEKRVTSFENLSHIEATSDETVFSEPVPFEDSSKFKPVQMPTELPQDTRTQGVTRQENRLPESGTQNSKPQPPSPASVQSSNTSVEQHPSKPAHDSSHGRGFGGLFGRRRRPQASEGDPPPSPTSTGELFPEEGEDELEIPAFLRRQAN